MRRGWLGSGVVLLVGLAACGEDDDTGTAQAPDVSGPYNVLVQGTSGCEGEASWIAGWAEGPLQIEQDGTALSWDFGDEIPILEGNVSTTGGVSVGGEAIPYDEAELDIAAGGRFLTEDGLDAITLSITVEVNDDDFVINNCTIEGDARATRLGDGG